MKCPVDAGGHRRRACVIRLGAAAALLYLAAACASTANSGGSPGTTARGATSTTTSSPPVSNPPPSTSPGSSTTVPAPATMDVRVYFLQGEKIAVAHRTVAASRQVAAAAVSELLSGPTPTDTASGLGTTIPSATRLLGINVAGGIATVDLTGTFSSGGGSLSMAGRLAQVTYTLTQFPTVTGVVFHLDGKAVTVFGGEGIILDHPATRDSFQGVVPAILVEYPGRGWAVQSPLRVAGTANVYEAQFQAEITDGSGRVLATQAIHATAGTGTRGSFDTTIAFPDTALGPATLTVFDTSPKDGSRIDVTTIALQLIGH